MMAQTKTSLTAKKANAAYKELDEAAQAFIAAIKKFQNKYDPDTVGLNEWVDDIQGTLFDIDEDIESTFAE